MKIPRMTVANLAVAVAVIAVNLGVGRALFAYQEFLLQSLAPMGLTLQFGCFRVLHTCGRASAFWAGFVAFGLAASASLVWAVRFGLHGYLISYSGGPPDNPISHAVTSGWFYLYWSACNPLPFKTGLRLITDSAIASYFFLPQLLIASVGGLFGRQSAKWWAVCPVPISATPSDRPAANIPSLID